MPAAKKGPPPVKNPSSKAMEVFMEVLDENKDKTNDQIKKILIKRNVFVDFRSRAVRLLLKTRPTGKQREQVLDYLQKHPKVTNFADIANGLKKAGFSLDRAFPAREKSDNESVSTDSLTPAQLEDMARTVRKLGGLQRARAALQLLQNLRVD